MKIKNRVLQILERFFKFSLMKTTTTHLTERALGRSIADICFNARWDIYLQNTRFSRNFLSNPIIDSHQHYCYISRASGLAKKLRSLSLSFATYFISLKKIREGKGQLNCDFQRLRSTTRRDFYL